ncbi:MAG: cellulose synthase operon protein YhjQ/BcsQ [Verrucomicrobiae bacterium]|nr:cellulose synthase operon protein YhjQ/BcsQ [Verrucomicrobiae bacterium]
MSTEEQKILETVLEEVRLLRRALERIEATLTSTAVKPVGRSRPQKLSVEEARTLYAEIRREYAQGRTTQKLDELLARPKSDLALFCAVNHLPIDLRHGKAGIREQLLARIREEEQLSAKYPLPSLEPAHFSEPEK